LASSDQTGLWAAASAEHDGLVATDQDGYAGAALYLTGPAHRRFALIVIFVRTSRGWEEQLTGGDPVPEDLAAGDHALVWTSSAISCTTSSSLCATAVAGIVGENVESLDLIQGDRVRRLRMDPDDRAFIALATGPSLPAPLRLVVTRNRREETVLEYGDE
jgi:hypothetical protein